LADANGRDDNGSKDRATVALVDAKVAIVDAKMDGLTLLVTTEFRTIREDVRALAGVAGQVVKLEATSADHERRIATLEEDKEAAREYRRGQLPSILVAGGSAIIAIVAILTQLH